MKKRSLRVRTARIIDGVVTYLIIALISFIFFVPCIWIVLASFSKSGSIYSFGGFFPSEYSFNSFIKLFTDTGTYDYPLWFGNTFKMVREYVQNRCVCGGFGYFPHTFDSILYVEISFQRAQSDDEGNVGAGHVSFVHEHDRRLSADDAIKRS